MKKTALQARAEGQAARARQIKGVWRSSNIASVAACAARNTQASNADSGDESPRTPSAPNAAKQCYVHVVMKKMRVLRWWHTPYTVVE